MKYGPMQLGSAEKAVSSVQIAAPRLVVAGSFGFGNAGDEAVPLAIGDLAKSAGCPIDLATVTRFREPSMPGIIGMGERFEQQIDSLRDVPLILAGGGIVEASPNCVLLRCSALIRQNRAGIYLFAGSVEHGVPYGWIQRRRIRKLLDRVQGIYVRDTLSACVLSDIAPKLNCEVIGDSVLALEESTECELPIEHGDFVAVTLCPRWRNSEMWLSWITLQLAEVARHLSCSLLFVPFSTRYDDDRADHHLVASRLLKEHTDLNISAIDREVAPRELKAIFRRARAVIGMRLHACVIAHSAECPWVGIGYHPKIFGFASTVGCLEQVVPGKVLSRQSAQYGYSFEESGLVGEGLVPALKAAMDRRCFDRTAEFRARQVTLIREIVG